MVNTIIKYWKKEPILEFELIPDFPIGNFVSGNVPWDELRKKYGRGVYINHGTELEWREEVLALENLEQSLKEEKDGKISLVGKIIDSFTIQAQRKEVIDDFSYLETAVYGIIADRERILLGIRGGTESVGEILGVPAGAVNFHETGTSPLSPAVYREANEEAGLLKEEINPRLIGLYRQEPGSIAPSNVFFYLIRLNGINLEDIQKRHLDAYKEYKSAKEAVDGPELEKEIHARNHTKKRGKEDEKFPADAWENGRLIIFPYNDSMVSTIADFVKKNKFKHSLYAALALSVLHRFGKQAYQEVINLPEFKENINSRI